MLCSVAQLHAPLQWCHMSATITGNWTVCSMGFVFNTWRAHRISFSGFIFSRMETTYLIVNICLCYISDVVSKSVMRRRHLISNIKFAADWSPLAHDPRIFSLMKIHFGSSPDVVKHYPNSKVHGANMGPTWVLSAPDGPHVGPMNLAIRVG